MIFWIKFFHCSWYCNFIAAAKHGIIPAIENDTIPLSACTLKCIGPITTIVLGSISSNNTSNGYITAIIRRFTIWPRRVLDVFNCHCTTWCIVSKIISITDIWEFRPFDFRLIYSIIGSLDIIFNECTICPTGRDRPRPSIINSITHISKSPIAAIYPIIDIRLRDSWIVRNNSADCYHIINTWYTWITGNIRYVRWPGTKNNIRNI